MKKIIINCLLSERWYCIRGFLSGLEGLKADKKKIPIYLFSSSQDNTFNDFILEQVSKMGWEEVHLVKTPFKIIHYVNGNNVVDLNDERFAEAIKTMNIAREKMIPLDFDYLWHIEDDVVIPPDALDKHLAMFGDGVGATVAYCNQRFDNENKGLTRYPLVWDLKDDFVFGKNDSSKEHKNSAIIRRPSATKWIEEIDSASTGSIMIRKDLLDKFEWKSVYKGVFFQDVAFGLQLKELGYKMMIDWSLKIKHLHYTGEVIL